MERQKRNKDKRIVGVVYKYTSPSGKVYIGQTTNEAHRRRTWFCMKRRYAGATIERARKKYGPENFEYEVLYKQEFFSFEEALPALDSVEKYYIGYYDSFKNGYNNTTGGLFPEFGIQTQLNGREHNISRNPDTLYHKRRFHPKHTKDEIQELRKETNRRNGRWQKIFQFDEEGNFIREFASAGEASEYGFGNACNIKRACKTLGKYNGYNWRFSEDGYVMKKKAPRKYVKEQYRHAFRPVLQYDKEMKYIGEYESITAAAHSLGINYSSSIGACLAGKIPTAHGYKWKYKTAI